MASSNFQVINGELQDLGGFTVRRVLPQRGHRGVGPFVFFDHMGPTSFAPGEGIDVRPHPHIALATITYLFEGEILHRDSLGNAVSIQPGAVNWMTAGRGIVHSERTAPERRRRGGRLHGIQAWVALPSNAEEVEPRFVHCSAATLPVLEGEGFGLRLIAGELFGLRSPVETASPLFYAELSIDPGAQLEIPTGYPERAAYVVDGEVLLAGLALRSGQMALLGAGALSLAATLESRIMLLGGEALDGPRYLWWNFVASSQERIERAKQDWATGRFPKVPGDEVEFIPLPED